MASTISMMFVNMSSTLFRQELMSSKKGRSSLWNKHHTSIQQELAPQRHWTCSGIFNFTTHKAAFLKDV
ncbi:hypothetical protein AMECASPLE_029145 [Ameca splendens]|uniref:Uncharacterized protein n=1 Tax=Ameca splendens TaxID=208324 RepID=A0ABV0YHS4_9TELE